MIDDLDLTREQKEQLLTLLKEQDDRVKYNLINTLFMDDDKAPILPGCIKSIARSNYPKHVSFFDAGADYTERAFIAGNQCFAANTKVLLANGKRKNIQDVTIDDHVLAYDIKKDKLVPANVIGTFVGTAANIIKVGVSPYHQVICTDDHPFVKFSRRGKHRLRPIKDILQVKHSNVVLPSRCDIKEILPNFSPDLSRLIGYLIGDGCLTKEFIQVTNTDEFYRDDVRRIVESLGLKFTKYDYSDDCRITVENGLKGQNYLINLLRELGLWGKYSGEKFIPKEILTAPQDYLIECLKGLLATDGCFSNNRFSYYTTSPELAEDLKFLLLRLNIVATIQHKKNTNLKHNDCYVVNVSSDEDLQKLPSIGRKQLVCRDNKTNRRRADSYVNRRINFISAEPEQKIYCITVDHPDHIFVANGFLTSNTGKTLTGLCELYWHCSGKYPSWWKGKRFNKPVVAWLCGDRGEIIRDSIQQDLMGRIEHGTGIIPKEDILETVGMQGTNGGIGQYFIKHVSGGRSHIIVKTYQAGKNAFEAAKVDVIMLDEECPMDIYVECQIRTITTGGTVYLTFTPDSGLTDTVLHFLNRPKVGEQAKFVVMVGWDDVPHLSEVRKQQLLATIPPHMRDVKTKGRPYLGAGAIYPIPEEEFVIPPFKVPEYWPKAYAFDPGWNKTAALWGAYDESSDTWYLYNEYYRGQAEPEVHAGAIKARGAWIEGIADPHGSIGGKGVTERSFLDSYEALGLTLTLATPSGPGSVEIGINEVYSRLSTGRLKVFNNLIDWLYEYRIYRRDDKGRIVKVANHLMDCTRYLMLCGASVMRCYYEDENDESIYIDESDRSSITGY